MFGIFKKLFGGESNTSPNYSKKDEQMFSLLSQDPPSSVAIKYVVEKDFRDQNREDNPEQKIELDQFSKRIYLEDKSVTSYPAVELEDSNSGAILTYYAIDEEYDLLIPVDFEILDLPVEKSKLILNSQESDGWSYEKSGSLIVEKSEEGLSPIKAKGVECFLDELVLFERIKGEDRQLAYYWEFSAETLEPTYYVLVDHKGSMKAYEHYYIDVLECKF